MRRVPAAFLTVEQERTASVNELVLAHEKLAAKMAKSFSRYGVDVEDLTQEGMLALHRAAQKFDPTKGFRFSTYAMFWLRQYLREAVIKNSSVVKPSTSTKALSTFFRQRPHRDVSMETPLSRPESGDELTLGATMASDEATPDEIVEVKLDGERRSNRLQMALKSLDPRSQDIIKSRFLQEKKEGLADIGLRYGISMERVRQIETKALDTLKKRMLANG